MTKMILNKLVISFLFFFRTVEGRGNIRGYSSNVEDSSFWGRELGGSHRRTRALEDALNTKGFSAVDEEVSFWERELGGSHRRFLNSIQDKDEDASFWDRELGGSHNRNLLWDGEEDAIFWERELGGSHRRRIAEMDHIDDIESVNSV
eukprot:CAMPEP_0172486780 /NCGR_PEP_ID=MMETSP1066-20121228/15507_1 /TAXON_ID=671091 /ORGANISM="Coscinodiscus wailesii, Strain CCMP2513" /LENGTH=147 /DNA_ID=CAMNT_0013252947 /DNA_START=31 /DNA_END=474 /DNA_ORIENTATION=+